VEDLKTLHDQALSAAAQAKKAVEQNSMVLQQKVAERTKLLSQLEQAKMQEQVSASLRSMSEIAAPGTTPSLDEVREKTERREALRPVTPRTVRDGGEGDSARAVARGGAARIGHRRRPFRLRGPKDQRRRRSAGAVAASPSPGAAVGRDIRRRLPVLDRGDGG